MLLQVWKCSGAGADAVCFVGSSAHAFCDANVSSCIDSEGVVVVVIVSGYIDGVDVSFC